MGSAASGDAIRHINEWSTNPKTGAASTRKATDDFGSLTFNDEAQRARLPKDVYRALRRSIAQSEPLDPVARRHRRQRAEGLGGRARRDALHALVPAADRHHRREARRLPDPDRRRPRRRRVQRQGAGQAASRTPRASPRAACAQPSRRAATPRGTRPARRGCWSPRTARRWSSRPRSSAGPARRSTRRRRCCARWTRCRKQAVRILKLFGSKAQPRADHVRSRAGILPDRPAVLFQPARPDQRRPHAVRRQAARRARRWRTTTSAPSRTASWRSCRKSSASSTRSACRSRPGTTRSRRASTRSRRSSRTPTSPPTTR